MQERQRTEERLNELTQEDLAELRSFAERRCSRLHLSPDRAEEFAQDALASVLTGLESNEGRHPKAHEVSTKARFIRYLYSVICSIAEADSRRDSASAPHTPVSGTDVTGPHGSGAVLVLRAPEAGTERVEMQDLKQVFFSRLRAVAAPRHHANINQWEEAFEYVSRIPTANRHRKYVREIRKLATVVATELGLSPSPNPHRRQRQSATVVAPEDQADLAGDAPHASCEEAAKGLGIPPS